MCYYNVQSPFYQVPLRQDNLVWMQGNVFADSLFLNILSTSHSFVIIKNVMMNVSITLCIYKIIFYNKITGGITQQNTLKYILKVCGIYVIFYLFILLQFSVNETIFQARESDL